MNDIESAIKDILESWGFSAEKIPESTIDGVETPDFLVRDQISTYIVEVKTREDDPERTAESNEALNRGELVPQHIPLVRERRLSEKIGHASSQLQAFVIPPEAFRFAWFVAAGNSQDAKSIQFEVTLYGSTRMFDLEASGDGHFPCYYFRNSDFFRHRATLDAAIVSTLESAKLCLNNLSPRYEQFKQTKLFAHFGSAVCDPLREETANRAFVVDSIVDRNNEQAVLDYLRRKYQRPKLMSIDLGEHSVTFRVPT